MKRLANKIHHQFVSGKINSAVYDYMQKIAQNVDDADSLIFDSHIKIMASLNVQTGDDCQQYFHIYANAPRAVEALLHAKLAPEDSTQLCRYAFTKRAHYDFIAPYNFTKLALDFINENKHLLKLAYPNNMGLDGADVQGPQYNVEKWVETMRHIYDLAHANNLPLDKVAQQATAKWDKDEQRHFQYWMRYYEEGNHTKYNVKTAQIFTNKQPAEPQTPDLSSVKNMFGGNEEPKPDLKAEKQQRLDEFRRKVRSRLRSVEELAAQFSDVLKKDVATAIRKDLYELKERVYNLELSASIVDSLIRGSNQMTKHGFVEAAHELKKIAQEVAENNLPDAPAEKNAPPMITPPPRDKDGYTEVKEEVEVKTPDEMSIPDVDATRSNIDVPNFNNITYAEAIKKLEEINSVVSERAVVRALAGVDIILSQLGIASFFVELTESQSKLLEAYNYSSTRIAKVISQLRGRRLDEVKTEHQPKEETKDVVETTEELAKPVQEVSTELPKQPAPAQPVQPPVK